MDEPEAEMVRVRQIYPVPIRHANFEHPMLASRPWQRVDDSTPIPWDPPPVSRCVSRRPQAVCSCGMYELQWAER